MSFDGNHVHTVPHPHTQRLEADIFGAERCAMLVNDVGIIVEGWNQACSRPPLTFTLLSIALQRINKAGGVLPTLCRQARIVSRFRMSGYGTRVREVSSWDCTVSS